MKKNLLYPLFLIMLYPSLTRAGVAGGELTYTWVSDSTYRFFFKLYNSCDGVPENNTYDLCVFNSCNPSVNYTVPMPKWTGTLPGGKPNGSTSFAACTAYPSKCENILSTIPNYREWSYSTTVTLNSRCTAWRFSVIINARNTSNNINAANFYVEALLDNRHFQGNSSPFYSVEPVVNVCANLQQQYNNGAVDSNKDSLVTELVIPMTSNSCFSTPGATTFQSSSPAYALPANPFQTGGSFNLQAQSGRISYTPAMAGANTVAIRTKEYRNDTLVGYVMRDVQVQVNNGCSANPVTLTPVLSTFTGGGYNAGTVYSCVGQPLSFCFDIESTNPAAVLYGADNHSFSIPSAASNYTHQNTDSVRGCFSWTPLPGDSGFKYLAIPIRDSACSGSGIVNYTVFTLPIFVYPPVKVLKDTTICPGSPLQLLASGGGGGSNFFWNTLPGGAGAASLSCNNCNNPVVTPNIATSYIATTNNPHCASSDTVVIGMLPSPLVTPLNDTLTCPNTPAVLNLKPTPPTGAVYHYKWQPSGYFISNDTVATPFVKPATDTFYTVTVGVYGSPCKVYDTIKIKVLDGYKVFLNDTGICLEQLLTFNAVGDTNYKYKWTSSVPNVVQFIPSDTIINPGINPLGIGVFTIIVKASYPGCYDSTTVIKIDVQPYPSVNIGNDLSLCLGKTVKLPGSVSPPDYPFALTWTPAAGLDSPFVASPTFSPSSTGQIVFQLKAISSAGCADSDKITVTVFSEELLTIATPDTAICGGDTIQLHMTGNGLKSFVWFPAFNISDPMSYDPYVSPPATITYFAWGSDANSCVDTQSVTVVVRPRGIIDLPDSVKVYPGEPYLVDPLGNCLYFSWFPSHGLSNDAIANPYMYPDSSVLYHVNGKTEFGCPASDSIKVILMDESVVDMPNAFAPLGRYNSVIKPVHLGVAYLKKFVIYNRWGNKMFETNDINTGWDGTYNGVLQPLGVYVYTLEGETLRGTPFFKQGNITLLR